MLHSTRRSVGIIIRQRSVRGSICLAESRQLTGLGRIRGALGVDPFSVTVRIQVRTQLRRTGTLAAIVALALVAGAAVAQPAFVRIGPETLYDAGERCAVPFWSVTDLNGDGRSDIVLGNTPFSAFGSSVAPAELMMWIAGADGSYTERARELFSGNVLRATGFQQVRVADFNGDGVPDVLVADQGIDTYVDGVPVGPWLGATPKLALSNGAGKWVDASDRLAALKPTFAHSAAVADVDGDGRSDVFVANTAVSPAYLLMNKGQGNFAFTRATLPAEIADWDSRPVLAVDGDTNRRSSRSYTSALFVDVDNDGDPDLIVMPQSSTPTGFLALNDGHGNFATKPPIPMPPGLYGGGYATDRLNPDRSMTISSTRGTVGLDIRAVDLNGDGYRDLVVIETLVDPDPADYTQYRGGRLQILINQQGRGFADETDARGAPGYLTGKNYDSYHGTLSVFDVNGDGYPDLIVTRAAGGYESHVFLNDGSGRFARATAIEGLPLDALLVPVSGGDGQDIRIARIRVEYYRVDQSTTHCKLRVQTYGRSGVPPVNVQGLWWNPAESGWGINFAHQGDIIFATWFTYDAGGKPWWLIAELHKGAAGVYTGPVSTVAGPAFTAVPFAPAPVETQVGTMTATFSDPGAWRDRLHRQRPCPRRKPSCGSSSARCRRAPGVRSRTSRLPPITRICGGTPASLVGA